MSFGDPVSNIQLPNIPAPEHLVPDLEGDQTGTWLNAHGSLGEGVQPKSDNNPHGTVEGIWVGAITSEVASYLGLTK